MCVILDNIPDEELCEVDRANKKLAESVLRMTFYIQVDYVAPSSKTSGHVYI